MGLYGRQRNGAPAKDASAPLHQTCPGLTKGKERLPFSAFALRGRWLKTPCRWIKAIASDACRIQFGSALRKRPGSARSLSLASRRPDLLGHPGTRAERERRQPACKPGSVWPRTRYPGRGGHSSGTAVAGRLKQPTRTTGLETGLRRSRAPVSSLFGLAPGGVCRAVRVAASAVRSYRTLSPLPRTAGLRAVCSLWHCPWGRPRRTLSGTVFPWSPDFPPRTAGSGAAARPADRPDVGATAGLVNSFDAHARPPSRETVRQFRELRADESKLCGGAPSSTSLGLEVEQGAPRYEEDHLHPCGRGARALGRGLLHARRSGRRRRRPWRLGRRCDRRRRDRPCKRSFGAARPSGRPAAPSSAPRRLRAGRCPPGGYLAADGYCYLYCR